MYSISSIIDWLCRCIDIPLVFSAWLAISGLHYVFFLLVRKGWHNVIVHESIKVSESNALGLCLFKHAQ